MKFLVDECLSPELAKRGIQAGHGGKQPYHLAEAFRP
jgi:hypothetical protein